MGVVLAALRDVPPLAVEDDGNRGEEGLEHVEHIGKGRRAGEVLVPGIVVDDIVADVRLEGGRREALELHAAEELLSEGVDALPEAALPRKGVEHGIESHACHIAGEVGAFDQSVYVVHGSPLNLRPAVLLAPAEGILPPAVEHLGILVSDVADVDRRLQHDGIAQDRVGLACRIEGCEGLACGIQAVGEDGQAVGNLSASLDDGLDCGDRALASTDQILDQAHALAMVAAVAAKALDLVAKSMVL